MDIKRNLIGLSVFLVALLAWLFARTQIYKAHPEWLPKDETALTTTAPVTTAPAATAPTTTAPVTVAQSSTTAPVTPPAVAVVQPTTVPTPPAIAPTPPTAAGIVAVNSDKVGTATIGSERPSDKTYSLALRLDPRGAGLSAVVLNDYYDTAEKKTLYSFQKPVPASEDLTRPLATRYVTFNGNQDVDFSTVGWALVQSSDSSATYVGTITDGGRPLLEVTKTFTVVPRTSAGNGFDVAVKQSFKNVGAKPYTMSATMNGPSVPARENDRSEDRRYVTGYDKGYKEVDIIHTFVGELAKDKPAKELVTNGDGQPLLWVGSCNSYFDAIFKPDYAGDPAVTGLKITSVSAGAIDTGSTVAPADAGTSLAVTTGAVTLNPGTSASFDGHAFFGPKSRQLLRDTPYYADFPRSYNTTLVYVSKFCSFITFGWLINVLYAVLSFFHFIVRDWGLAIIGLVCLVRLMLHPVTKKAQINMLRMSKMGPEIERLKKKYGDDKDGLNKAMMQVYREQGVGGFLGCLPMFLQTPIWIALWNALSSTFELRQAPFLQFGHVHLTWISDLSRPDALVQLTSPFHLFSFTLNSINILPLLMAGVTYLQQSLTPAPAVMTPEQEQQRKMMKWMSLIVPVFLYSSPSGLTLYILTSSTIGIIESKIIRDHIKAREEAEKDGRVIVDTKPSRSGKRRDGPVTPEKPTGWLGNKIAEIMAKAEEVKREADRRKS